MSFTAEHYWKLAGVFNEFRPLCSDYQRAKHHIIKHLAKMLVEDNPKFNATLFIEACYDKEGT